MKKFYLMLMSIVSAILYRLGGSSKEDQDKEFSWIPKWFKKIPKKRDVMCNLLMLGAVNLMGLNAPWWAWVVSFGLLWASLSTYWDFMFGFDNHWFHGFMCGFSLLPVAIYNDLLPFFIKCVFLAVSIGLWSKYNGKANKEELGRGFLLIFSNIIYKIF